MVAELFPQRVMGVAFGFLNAVSFLASLAAPYVAGWIKDRSGSFAPACYLAGVIGLLAVPLALLVRIPPGALPGSAPTWQIRVNTEADRDVTTLRFPQVA